MSQDQDQDEDTSLSLGLCFHSNHGKNIMLSDGQRTARRTASYNQGVVVSSLPLPRNRLLEVRSHCTQILDLHSAGVCSYCSIPQKNRFLGFLFLFFAKHIIVGHLFRRACICPLQYTFHSLAQTALHNRVTFKYDCVMSL